MKKYQRILAVLLCGCLLSATAACREGESQKSKGSSSLRIVVDIDFGSTITTPRCKTALEKYQEVDGKTKSFETVIAELGGPKNVAIEFAPPQGEKRSDYLKKLRTEIMSGMGPDVFICFAGPNYVFDLSHATSEGIGGSWEDPIFRFPQQALERQTFLRLDEYMENSRFTDWSALPAAILDGGKYEGGQYVLPMTYTLPLTLFKSEEFSFDHSESMTWDAMLEKSPEMAAAASADQSIYLGGALGPALTQEGNSLAFSEDELLSFMTKKAESYCASVSNAETPNFLQQNLCVSLEDYSQRNGFTGKEAFTMVPAYTTQGGYGATIMSFAAIDANCSDPEGAFFVLDYLLSEECQQSEFYSYLTLGRSVPIMDSVLSEDKKCVGLDGSHWSLSPENYQEFCSLRDNISYAEFNTPLGVEMQSLFSAACDETDPEAIRNLVHEYYGKMKMLLAES